MSVIIFDFEGVPDYADEVFWVELEAEDGGPFDWSASTFSMLIGRDRGEGEPAVVLTQADGDIVPSLVGGKSRLTFRFRPEKFGDLERGRLVHSIIETVGGRARRFGKGTITIEEGPAA